MKKFLFTLLTLFMASSAFAEGGNYFYMDNFTVVKTKLGEVTVKANVKGHFDNYVSAWQCDLGYVNENGEEVMNALPEGMTKVTSAAGADMKNLPYVGEDGSEAEYSPNLKKGMSGTRLIVAADEGNYSPDGELYGCVKWAPGNYNQMWTFTFTCSKDFTGAKLILKTLPSCGADTRPEISENLAPTVLATSPVCIVDVKYIAPEPVFTWNETTYTMDAAVPEGYNAEDYEIVMYANGVEVEFPYTVEQTTDEQTIVFTAYTKHAADETYDSNDATYGKTTEQTVTVPAKQEQQEPAPAATISNEGNVVTAAVAGHTVELYIVTKDGEGNEVLTEVPNPYTVEQTFSEQKITFKALTKANEGESEDTWSEPKEITIDAKPDNQCPQPEFAYYQTPDNELWARVMYYGEAPYTEHVELYIVTTNDEGEEVLTPVDNPYKGLPTENNTFEDIVVKFKAIVKADGVNYNVDNYDYYTVTIPGKEDKQAPAPTFRVDGDKLYAEKDNLTVELYKKNDDGTWTKVDNPYEGLPTENTSYTEPIKIDFKAITLADGVTYNVNSDEATYTYTIDPLNKKTAQKPTIVGANETDATYDIVITPDPNTDGTLEYTATPMGAVVRADATTIRYERKDTEYTVHVEASTTAGETYLASEVAEADIVIPAKPAPEVIELPDPTISETHDAANQTTIITITVPENTPEGTVLNYTLTDEDGYVIPASDYTVTATDGKIVITIPNGAETAFVTVTATTTMPNAPEGVVVENGEATKTVEVPQYQQTAAPTIDVSFGGEDGAHYANVTFVNNDAKPATIEYSLDNGETWLPYTGAPVVITTYGETTVLARATAEGKATSEVAERSFMLNDDATSVNELVNGKTVAGVRYFNMAGQEMQEANGITIVVTTYTDGTTTAVKVIK